MPETPDFHAKFHDVLGHLTIIKTVLWELGDAVPMDQEHKSMIDEAQTRITGMIHDLENLKNDVYKTIEETKPQT